MTNPSLCPQCGQDLNGITVLWVAYSQANDTFTSVCSEECCTAALSSESE